MKNIKLKCDYCGNIFERLLKEYNRNKKENTKIFCNQSCSTKHRNLKMTKEHWKKQYLKNKNKYIDIRNFCHNRRDEFSPFRFFINKCKCRNKETGVKVNIDVIYLKNLWNSQNGKCSYTGIKMMLPDTTNGFSVVHSLYKASLDRIDSSKGYIKGNVEFVCYAINNAKNDFSKQEMISFVNDILINKNTISINQEQPA